MKKAFITGINGQDGSYLAELLLSKGYEVHGSVRRSSLENQEKLVNITHIIDKIHLHPILIDNQLSLYKAIESIRPDECYHLAAASFVSYDFNDEASTISSNFNSTHFLLSCIKELAPQCRFYCAGSSEMFGNATESPQSEATKFNPRSIYGISKLASFHVVRNYREHHKVYASTGITYNHESPRRGFEYVTRKISSSVAKIQLGIINKIELGNLDAKRDWGYAPDYVQAMWLMLNKSSSPKDYVIASGKTHSVRDLLKTAFDVFNLDYQKYVVVKEQYFRPSEPITLVGNSELIKSDLGWKTTKEFKDIVQEMVLADFERLKNSV